MFALEYHEERTTSKMLSKNLLFIFTTLDENVTLQIPAGASLAINESQCMHIL